MVEISSKERNLLTQIAYDPRITLKKLGQTTRMSKDAARYSLTKLEKIGIIQGYSCMIDYKKLGHKSYKLFLKLRPNFDRKNELRNYLRKEKHVFAVFESLGNWNLAIAIFANSDKIFNTLENNLMEKFGDLILSKVFIVMIDAELLHTPVLKDSQEIREKDLFWAEEGQEKLDAIDKKLVTLLHENARTSLVDLSKELPISIDSIRKRMKKLNSKKILNYYHTVIDYSVLGFDHYKLFIFPKKYSQLAEEKIMNFLRETEGCINIVRTIGAWKIEAEFMVTKSSYLDRVAFNLTENYNEEIFDVTYSKMMNQEFFPCKSLLLE